MDNSTGQDDTENEVYIGNSVHNKQSTISFKNKKKVRKPESEWFRVENTHEAIIDKDVFSVYRSLSSPDADRERTRKHRYSPDLSNALTVAGL